MRVSKLDKLLPPILTFNEQEKIPSAFLVSGLYHTFLQIEGKPEEKPEGRRSVTKKTRSLILARRVVGLTCRDGF